MASPTSPNPPIVTYLRMQAPSSPSTSSEVAPATPDHALHERANATLSWMQPGLIYPAPHQCALSVFSIPGNLKRADFAAIVSAARRRIHDHYGSQHASVCIAFSFKIWTRFCADDGRRPPEALTFEQPKEGNPYESAVLARTDSPLADSRGDAWMIVKADTSDAVSGIADFVVAALCERGVSRSDVYRVAMSTRTNPTMPKGGAGGRVLGGRFQENLRNPVAPVEILEHVLVGPEEPSSTGGAVVFTQRFNLNWAEIHAKPTTEVESLIGRRAYTDELVPAFDARSHIRSAHAYDVQGNTIKLLRVGLPFGHNEPSDDGTPLLAAGGTASRTDEAGTYFIGIARSAARIERILQSQLGSAGPKGFIRDRLLGSGVARSDLGGFFYAPSVRELGAEALTADLALRCKLSFTDWRYFPGVDWSRLNRHYEKRSANGWMFYNHQDFLFTRGTGPATGDDAPGPLSLRVQFLLERAFAKWDDTWFRAQKPRDLDPLRPQLERFFADPSHSDERDEVVRGSGDDASGLHVERRAAAAIMRGPVALRSAWAQRLLLYLASRLDGAGRHGDGGMDTCDVHPLDLLAGSLPAQSLAEGRYLIDYTRDDDGEAEHFAWFNLALGPNSGVGHVVPDYETLLSGGLDGMNLRIDEAAAALAKSEPDRAPQAAAFFEASRIAVKGLAGYFSGLADTVRDRATALGGTAHDIEHQNLNALEGRLRHLASGKPPRTVLEALQIVLSCHTALHLVGEPVAVGRLDRVLRPFQKRTPLSLPELQEAIDCFWIKLAEKTLLNRIFIDDRQELGNLAMGNRAGPYPKGQSVNQWIQQVTVGGRNPDGTWEHSDVTVACLRASARLPFNAPVLSLRVSKDMPADWRKLLLAEAAKGQRSGGASPILLNDDKIIPALAQSGDDIGPPAGSPTAALWRSKVIPEDAYHYACDGCYEPQFVGANWFHLGGVVLLQMLEYALNQGRQILSVGPVDLLGKNMSFRSPPASASRSYEDLETLFFKHLEWNFAKQMESTVADFGRMESVCPAPLGSLFIRDCLERGRDLYGGGARYNVFGPCFTSLANTVNALWAIRVMCFDEGTSVTTLGELVQALLCNWGENVVDPLVHSTVLVGEPTAVEQAARRFRHLRSISLSLPRWGRGDGAIDTFGNAIGAKVAEMAVRVMRSPRAGLAQQYEKVATRLGTTARPFGGFAIQPGVGTFASYVEQGLGCAASADGRLAGQPIGTDMSPAPSPVDQPATAASQQRADGISALRGVASPDAFGFSNGAPIDLNVTEDMSAQRLVEILDAFVDGAGANILTVTVANQETFVAATASPEAFDLLRVRMGGWTEMFVAMHAAHQRVHPRRPFSY